MFSLTYVSSAVHPFSAGELRQLLETSIRNNRNRHVTGMLLYKDGNFMQVLEGEKEVVHSVHATIERDPRHRGLITLLRVETSERLFADWSMGFKDLGTLTVAPDGYSDFLKLPLTGAEFRADPSKAQTLLLAFKKNM